MLNFLVARDPVKYHVMLKHPNARAVMTLAARVTAFAYFGDMKLLKVGKLYAVADKKNKKFLF